MHDDSTNGHTSERASRDIRLPPHKVARLSKMYLRVEGAEQAVQGAQTVAQTLRQNFQSSLAEACEDAGFSAPEGSTAQVESIDWNTGIVSILVPPPTMMDDVASQPYALVAPESDA